MSVVQSQPGRFTDPENLPPKPVYVFRGHVAEITTLNFIRNDTQLVSGDTDGWIVIWNMTSRRPVAVWKAHEAGVLSIREWGEEKLITHGRDGKVFVWQLKTDEEGSLDCGLPADGGTRRKPWLLHSVEVKDMTFCGVDVAVAEDMALIATSSGGLGELIDVIRLPHKDLFCAAVGKNPPEKLGMTMSLRITQRQDESSQFILAAGYESGHACVYNVSSSSWSLFYTFKSHSQPVLSLTIHPSQESFYTTSADAILAHHPIAIATQPIKSSKTKHSGQTSLQIRRDGRILVSAGWDGVGRVYSATTLRQLAVLKWHGGGLQAAAFSSGDGEGNKWIVLGGKDAKITLWDVFN